MFVLLCEHKGQNVYIIPPDNDTNNNNITQCYRGPSG